MTFTYPTGKRNGMRTAPIGAVKRVSQQWEAAYARTFEQLLQLHGLDFWHCSVSQRSQPGYPDYIIFGRGWLAFAELKARNPLTKRAGKLSAGQYRYKASIEAANADYRVFLLPDDWGEVDKFLNARTHKNIVGWGAAQEVSA
jgi:hypothetical protein